MKYLFVILNIFFLFFAVSCDNEKKNYVNKTISLDEYERLEKDSITEYMELTMLNIYPAKRDCSGTEKYANLYVAKLRNSKVLYVFEPCMKVADYVYDTTGRYVPLIVPEGILNEKQNKVVIFVPKDFAIPKGAKYLFAEISVLDDF